MKRYWKYMALTIFTLAILGGYYVQTSAKQNHGYNVTLNDQSGDPKVVKDLTIQGDFDNFDMYTYTTFKLKNNKVTFENDLSYFKNLDGIFQDSPRLRRYAESYRSFMRGKIRIPQSFSEDGTYITYVKDEAMYKDNDFTQTLIISKLNKETKKEEEFTYTLPTDSSGDNYSVSDTFYKNNKVYVLLQRTEYTMNAYEDTFQLFVWDFETQKMTVENNPLSFLPDEKNTTIQLIGASPGEKNLNYSAFIVTSGESKDEYGELQGDIQSYAFIFDYESGEIKKVENDTSTELSSNLGGQRKKDELYLFMFQKNSPLLKIDITEDSPETTQLIEGNPIIEPDFDDQDLIDEQSESTVFEEADYMDVISIHDGKMYALDAIQTKEQPSVLSVVDIQTGKEVYNGSIELNNGKALPMEYEVSFHYLSFENE